MGIEVRESKWGNVPLRMRGWRGGGAYNPSSAHIHTCDPAKMMSRGVEGMSCELCQHRLFPGHSLGDAL